MMDPQLKKSLFIDSIIREESDIIFISEYMKLRFRPVTDNIIRITAVKRDDTIKDPVIGLNCKSGDLHFDLFDCGDHFELSTSEITICINSNDSSVKYYSNSGKLLLSQTGIDLERFSAMKPLAKNTEDIKYIETPDGRKPIAENARKVFYKSLYRSRLTLGFNDDEAIYGFGQYPDGKLNIRHSTKYVHQANMQIALPLMVSTNGYGMLFDMYCPMIFDDSGEKPYLYTEGSDSLDFYFIKGTPADIVAGYRAISGKASLLPKWAYGYIQSMERYENQTELIDVLSEYRRRKLGIDCVVLDWLSWQGDNWGDKNLDPERFPEPEKMMDKIHEMNGHLMISLWPNIEKGENHDEMADRNFFMPNSVIYNAFLPDARKLYWEQTDRGLFSKGIDAFWCDSSEPFTPEWGRPVEPPPSSAYSSFINAFENSGTIDMANAYSLFHSQSVYDGMRRSGKRVLNLTRSSYTGQQKYGTIVWSGDISASWDVFRKQIAAGLSMSASGFPWWTLDIGGFFTKRCEDWYWNGNYDKGAADLGYRELYVRWYQYAAFLPMFRAHGTDTRREMWVFGDDGDIFYDTLVKYNRLRYKLMPTIYSIAGLVWKNDASFFSPLSFIFCDDKNTYDIKDQFMVGNNIMVCPVTNPMYYASGSVKLRDIQKTRAVYLPAGTGWYDFHTNKHYDGGQFIMADADLDIIPVFIKDGAAIITGEASEYADHNADKPMTITIYTGADGYTEFYEDSGDGYEYEKGDYMITDIRWSDDQKKLDISGSRKNEDFKINII